ncbi:MAG: class I SAM-dependent methyltransferase [Syntrophorhabdaceae bacterium]
MTGFDANEYKKIERAVYSATAASYERYGSTNFEAYAVPLIESANFRPGQSVLDIACGPGTPSLMIAPLVQPQGKVTGIDLAPGMIEIARQKAKARGLDNVFFQEADAENLPFDDGTFDTVICNHGLVHMTDRPQALREMLRVLKKDGGTLALSVWSTPDRACVIGIIAEVIKDIWPEAIVPGAPMWFDFGPDGILEKVLEETGLKNIRTARYTVTSESASVQEYWEGVIGISGRLQMLLAHIPPDIAAKLKERVFTAAGKFRASNSIRIPCEEVIAIART